MLANFLTFHSDGQKKSSCEEHASIQALPLEAVQMWSCYLPSTENTQCLMMATQVAIIILN